MGIETIIGGALGLGGSLLSSRNNSRATEQATNAQLQGNQASLDLMERLYNQNRDDLSPFRDFELQRTNALGEIFGFDAVGGNDNGGQTGGGQFPGFGGYGGNTPGGVRPGAPGGGNRDVNPLQDYTGFTTGGGGQFGSLVPDPTNPGVVTNPGVETRNISNQLEGGGQGVAYNGQNPGEPRIAEDVASYNPGTGPQTGGGGQFATGGGPATGGPGQVQQVGGSDLGPTVGAGVNGADRFNDSLFNSVFTNNFNRDRDRVDNSLANSGLLFSGARTNAIENSRANNFGNALQSYLNTLMGAPSSGPATNAGVNNSNQFAANGANINSSNGNILANSAYQNAANNNNLISNFTNLGGFALGAFGGGK